MLRSQPSRRRACLALSLQLGNNVTLTEFEFWSEYGSGALHMRFVSSFLFALLLSISVSAQSPAETRAREIAQLINSADRAAIKKYAGKLRLCKQRNLVGSGIL